MRSARRVPRTRFARRVPRTLTRPAHRHAAGPDGAPGALDADEGVPAGVPVIHGASGVVSPTRKAIVPATIVPGGEVHRISKSIPSDFVVTSSG